MGPGGKRREHPEGARLLPALDRAEAELRERLSDIGGCRVERKKFAVAVHYREVAEENIPAVEKDRPGNSQPAVRAAAFRRQKNF